MRSLRESDDDSVENKKKDVDEVESAGKEKADGEKEKMRSLRESDDDSVENKKKDVDEVESAGKEKADGEVLVVVVIKSQQDPNASMLLA
ncbi:hypothetical protein DY000_02037059 [Brassica cretica]|uniref:Uncharacterized protein n=1 Tax=Brassica cretica TaxID=69181 RepID=A0ABQ7B5W6_BRACR|nr:hypothetical protein DY000_02037059 [Brassica cretica]